jgi:hypothetical protein
MAYGGEGICKGREGREEGKRGEYQSWIGCCE